MIKDNKLDKYLVIVSKADPMTPEKEAWFAKNFEYVPYTDEDGASKMEVETFKAYTAFIEYMKKKHHLDVDARSVYRNIETQEAVYKQMVAEYGEEWAKTHVAPPGATEHHTALAVDFRYKPSFVPEVLRAQAIAVAKKTGLHKKAFNLIEQEAVNFGFIKRYDASKEKETGYPGEAWHFRFVGKEHAKAMHSSGMCLEEYVKLLTLQNQQAEEAVYGNQPS